VLYNNQSRVYKFSSFSFGFITTYSSYRSAWHVQNRIFLIIPDFVVGTRNYP
jgi:hypothetical protein